MNGIDLEGCTKIIRSFDFIKSKNEKIGGMAMKILSLEEENARLRTIIAKQLNDLGSKK
jgi:hypothetical protein